MSLPRLSSTPVWRLIVPMLVVGATSTASAQDTHYWTEQFGNRAYLLSGAVVGDTADLSAIYYNPGGLARHDVTEFLLAGLGIDAFGTTVRNALLDGSDLSKSSTRFVPSLVAGEIPTGSERHRFAYSVLTRHRSDLEMFSAFAAEDELPEDLTLVANSLDVDSEISEYWLGGTWAYRLHPALGVGVTTFVAARDQRLLTSGLLQGLAADQAASVVAQSYRYKFRHWRLLWKLGLNGRIDDWTLGATVTTRGLGLGGGGELAANATALGQTSAPAGGPSTFIATTIQPRLTADYRSPFSLALGASRQFGRTTVHLTTEWFEAISLYDVVAASPFRSQTSGQEIDPTVREQLSGVTNVGFGVEQIFSDGVTGYFGFHTDFSGSVADPASNASFSKWDFYHVSGGATFPFNESSVTLGASLGLADERISTDRRDPFLPVTLPDNAHISAYRLTIILGFNFSL